MPTNESARPCDGCNRELGTCSLRFTNRFLCIGCFQDCYTSCGGCGADMHHQNDTTHTANGITLCETCNCHVTENCRECDQCRNMTPLDDLNDDLCSDCYREDTWEYRGFFVETPATTELKSSRRFGIEIETSSCANHPSIRPDTVFGCKPDGSVDGMEFVSPILYGDEGLNEVRKICGHARRLDWEIDSSCGLHLHVDLTDEDGQDCFKLAYAYMHTYDFWTSFISDARKRNYYCARHTYSDPDILSYRDFNDWCTFASNGSRYDWVNWYAYLQHGTVELRHHTATLNGEKICNWIKSHTRFIDKVLSMPQVTLTRALAGRDVHAQSEAIAEWWEDDELTDFYKNRAISFNKPFRQTHLVGV